METICGNHNQVPAAGKVLLSDINLQRCCRLDALRDISCPVCQGGNPRSDADRLVFSFCSCVVS